MNIDDTDELMQPPGYDKPGNCESVNVEKKDKSPHGLTMLTAAVFVVGEMAGSGVLALPKAVVQIGWVGIILIIACCLMSGYCGIHLGKCWVMLLERYPEYSEHVRDPYPAIGYRAYGKIGSVIVSVCIDITLFGVATVFILIAAENLQSLLQNVHADLSFCFWLLILGAFLLPFTWLGTPKDFWPIAVFAMVATSFACLLIFIAVLVDLKPDANVIHSDTTVEKFAMAFGTILFSFGGAAVFPTVQHDMKEPTQFPKSVFIAFSILLAMYLPVATAGYFIYGDEVKDNVLNSITPGALQYIVQTLITLHLMFAFIIVVNPFCQEFEHLLKIPIHFNWKRCVLRTVAVCLILFVAETIPHFGAILSLIGGSTVTLLTFVLPNVFYLKLTSMENLDWKPEYVFFGRVVKTHVPLYKKAIGVECIIIGIIGGIVSTYSAIKSMTSPDTFIAPCYINPNITSS